MLTTQALRHRLAVGVARGLRRLRREGLDQLERRAQVRADVPVPALPGRGRDGVVLEDRGVVDQHGQRPAERRRRRRHQRRRRRPVEQVRRTTAAARPAAAQLRRQRLGGVRGWRGSGSPRPPRAPPARAPSPRPSRCAPPVTSAALRSCLARAIGQLGPQAQGSARRARRRRSPGTCAPTAPPRRSGRPSAAAACRASPGAARPRAARGRRARSWRRQPEARPERARSSTPRPAPRATPGSPSRRNSGRRGAITGSAPSRRRARRIIGTRCPIPSASPTSTPACADPDLAGEEVVARQPLAAARPRPGR